MSRRKGCVEQSVLLPHADWALATVHRGKMIVSPGDSWAARGSSAKVTMVMLRYALVVCRASAAE